ncbi:MAG: GNAT family N-acetyltransferase [Luteitalea sp.]
MVIRPTTAADVEALHALVTAVCRERRFLGSTTGFTVDQTRGYVAHVQATGGVSLVALEQERLVGWVDIVPGAYEGLTHGGRLGMGLAHEARGCGRGAALLERALEEGFARLDRIELEVFASNTRAIALYRRVGFREEGCRRRARRLDGLHDDILMFGLLRTEWRQGPVMGDLPGL